MPVLHVTTAQDVTQLIQFITRPDAHVFVLAHLEGCGPCKLARPLWENLAKPDAAHSLVSFLSTHPHVMIADVPSTLTDPLLPYLLPIDGYPSIQHVFAGGTEKHYFREFEGIDHNNTTANFSLWIQQAVRSPASSLAQAPAQTLAPPPTKGGWKFSPCTTRRCLSYEHQFDDMESPHSSVSPRIRSTRHRRKRKHASRRKASTRRRRP
jgi:hypothetical protein